MDAQELQNAYDAWKESERKRTGLDESSKNIFSDEPNQRAAARVSLERLINEQTPGLISPNTPTDSMLRHVGITTQVYRESAASHIKKGAKEFVQKAYSEKKAEFAKNYAEIAPIIIKEKDGKMQYEAIKTGDKKIDDIINYHLNYYQLDKAIEAFEKEPKKDQRKLLEFAAGVEDLVAKRLYDDVVSTGVSEETAKRRIALAMEVYKTEPDKIYLMARALRDKTKKYLDKQFENDEQKSEYAKSLLEAKASSHEMNYGNLSEDLYKVISG